MLLVTDEEILEETLRPLVFDGNISDLEGFSSDDEGDETFVPLLDVSTPNESSSDVVDEQAVLEQHHEVLQQPRNHPPWRHIDIFEPLPPAPAFDEAYWPGKDDAPEEYFIKYIPSANFELMSSCTNRSSLARRGKSLNTTAQEISIFFGISLKMSYLGYPRLSMYWAFGTRVPEIADKMPRNRFFSIRSCLKLVMDDDVPTEIRSNDKFWKIRPLLKTVRAGCLQNPRTRKVSIDEQIVPFWGHTSMRQYIRGKPNPCGLKNFVCTSRDGLPLDFFMYEGKGDTILADNYEHLNIGGKVVMRLAQSLPAGSIIYMDRYFTSIQLLDSLHADQGCQGTGTIQMGRIPSDCKLLPDAELKKQGRGAADQSVRGDGQIAIVKWYDNKPVILASSVEGKLPMGQCRRWSKKDKEYVPVSRPLIVESYNENMGGVDMLDRIIATYRQNAKTRKWTVRLILHLFDFACAAAWIEYRRDNVALKVKSKDIMDYLQFKIKISEWLLHLNIPAPDTQELEEEEEVMTNTSTKRRNVITAHPSEAKRKAGASHMPEIANDDKNHRCRMPGCKSVRARVYCTVCKIHLCLIKGRNCFREYHMM